MIKVNEVEVEFNKFGNNETHFDFMPLSMVNKVFFKYENDQDLINLLFVKKYIDDKALKGAFSELIISYMPYSRMDRTEGSKPFTLKYVAEFINQLNFDNVIIIEPHSDVTTALVNKAEAAYINFALVEEVKDMVGFDFEEDVIVFPDAGAAKRYANIEAKNVIVGNKKRDFQSGRIVDFELFGDVKTKGSLAIIVDDLSSYGGTFVGASKKLREQGFEQIFLLVAHAENAIFKGQLFNYVDKVFTTDSILTEQNSWENKKFADKLKVFKLEEILNV